MYDQLAIMAFQAVLAGGKVATDIAGSVGKRVIEVAVPMIKKASQISLNFITGDDEPLSESKDLAKCNSITLSKSLAIVQNALSIPLSFSSNQFKTFQQEVTHDLNIIKGQNEIMFLSNSIAYFVDSHTSRTGLDRGISYALQYDIAAVRNHLKKSRDLRFPGYLLHQCTCLAETIKEMNVFYTSIINHGNVPSFTPDEVQEELSMKFGANQRKGDIKSYIPYELQLPVLRSLASEQQKNKTFFAKFFGENGEINIEEVTDIAHEALFLLSEELVANEELEHRISKMVKNLPNEKLIVHTAA